MLEKSTLQSVAMDTMLRSRRAALIRPERKQHLQVQSLTGRKSRNRMWAQTRIKPHEARHEKCQDAANSRHEFDR